MTGSTKPTNGSSSDVTPLRETKASADLLSDGDGLLSLAVISLIAGAASGLVGALFRLSLVSADRLRERLVGWAQDQHALGLVLIVVICTAATAVAAWLVRRFAPYASGSGIPHVEAVIDEQLPSAPPQLIPVKFFGGILAIGSGLALGREGPSVQMGASISDSLGRLFGRNEADCRTLLAAGAGAGLATAFNAPIAGAIFVLEELVRRFDTRVTIATFGASAGAIAIGRVLLGDAPDFHVEPLPYLGAGTVPVHVLLGVIAGLLAVAYNRTLLGTLDIADRFRRWPVELRAAAVGAVVGVLAWCRPEMVGGGDIITQRTLAGTDAAGVVMVVFLVRFVLGPASYAAATPGGLFAPLLVLGAQIGYVFGVLHVGLFSIAGSNPAAYAVIGMAAFFTGVVRAPVTGIVLVIEMTATFTMLLPMLAACFSAMLVPVLLRDAPIYEALRERTLKIHKHADGASGQ
jgi:chloride channel protein, CIC family